MVLFQHLRPLVLNWFGSQFTFFYETLQTETIGSKIDKNIEKNRQQWLSQIIASVAMVACVQKHWYRIALKKDHRHRLATKICPSLKSGPDPKRKKLLRRDFRRDKEWLFGE